MHLGCRTGLDLFACFLSFIFVLFFFFNLFFFLQWKKPIYSNFLQLHNEVPFSDVQCLKVRESLAAVKQRLMLLQSVWAQEFTLFTPSSSPGAGRSCVQGTGALEHSPHGCASQETAITGDIALNFKICCAFGWVCLTHLSHFRLIYKSFSLFSQSFHSVVTFPGFVG